MKSLKHSISFFAIFLYVAGIMQPLYGAQAVVKTVQMSIEKVDKEISLLDKIIEQANIIVDGADQKIRNQAKKELIALMKNKDLDSKIKQAINDDIEIIKKSKTQRELDAARTRLLNTYTKINSQANVVETIAKATAMVKNASPENLKETIAQAKEKIEKAEEEQQSTMGWWYAKAKRMVTAPVDYVFGEESSYAKTAFYGAIGLAVLAAGTVGMYNVFQQGSPKYSEPEPVLMGDVLKAEQLDVVNAFVVASKEELSRKISAAKLYDGIEQEKKTFVGQRQLDKLAAIYQERFDEWNKAHTNWQKAQERALQAGVDKDYLKQIYEGIRKPLEEGWYYDPAWYPNE